MIFRVFAIALCALLATSANAGLMPMRPGVVVIDRDDGGQIDTYLSFYARLEAAGIPIRVEGLCISACTLVLALPRSEVCVSRTATFGFHLASNDDHPLPELTAALVARYYPAAVQQWIKEHGPLTPNLLFLPGGEAISLGILSECAP